MSQKHVCEALVSYVKQNLVLYCLYVPTWLGNYHLTIEYYLDLNRYGRASLHTVGGPIFQWVFGRKWLSQQLANQSPVFCITCCMNNQTFLVAAHTNPVNPCPSVMVVCTLVLEFCNANGRILKRNTGKLVRRGKTNLNAAT